jgi:hypothetical protein
MDRLLRCSQSVQHQFDGSLGRPGSLQNRLTGAGCSFLPPRRTNHCELKRSPRDSGDGAPTPPKEQTPGCALRSTPYRCCMNYPCTKCTRGSQYTCLHNTPLRTEEWLRHSGRNTTNGSPALCRPFDVSRVALPRTFSRNCLKKLRR